MSGKGYGQTGPEEILVANSQNPHSFVEVGPITAEVPGGAGPFATSLRTLFTSVGNEADLLQRREPLAAPTLYCALIVNR